MIDTLVRLLPRAEQRWPALRQALNIPSRANGHDSFALVTLHRPANVDGAERLQTIMRALEDVAQDIPVLFAVHPRTRQQLQQIQFHSRAARLRLLDPMSYVDFLALQHHAALVITDSGGIQEETTFLRVPCLTLRDNTERPITVTHGTNTLIGRNPKCLREEVARVVTRPARPGQIPPLWDGQAGERIAAILFAQGLKPAAA
jgi:UDP-N-acetylglucosamine 2-epimerase (non-hydrolysing)